jgi:sortase A
MKARTRKTLRWGQYALLLAGCAALAYCAVILLQAKNYQARAEGQLAERTAKGSSFPVSSAVSSSTSYREVGRVPQPAAVSEKSGAGMVGRIDIPAAGISAMIADGDSSDVLRLAVGHVPGTALPGHSGNVGLAAHRDSFFRGLGDVKQGDVIRVTVPGKEYVYRVKFTDIVTPKETWVLRPTPYEGLTLITCYPFHYVGTAPKRFIVRAERSKNE